MMALETTSNMLGMGQLREPPRRRWSLYGATDEPPTAAARSRASLTAAVSKSDSVKPSSSTTTAVEADKRKRSRSRSVDLSPFQSNLKKAPTAFTAKLSQCVDALGLREALHRYHHHHHHSDTAATAAVVPTRNSKGKHVHFAATLVTHESERPATTEQEKRSYHYSRHELTEMVLDAKESLVRETHYCTQPDSTIFEQGFLTLPNETHLFHPKRYYCLLKPRGELLCYASPVHAAKHTHIKCRFSIIKVQECSAMSMQAKIAAFGAHLPSSLSLLFFATKADGERVLLAAESRASKKSWVHTLSRITTAHESLPPCVLRQSSTASTCPSEGDEEETPETKKAVEVDKIECEVEDNNAEEEERTP